VALLFLNANPGQLTILASYLFRRIRLGSQGTVGKPLIFVGRGLFLRLCSVILVIIGLVAYGSKSNAAALPNIVIIFTDDQGYADVGVFGAKGFETPNLDGMAREGRKFTNFHVPQPVCSASRAGLLTGCYSNRIGIHGALGPNATHGISDSEMTLAQLLKQKGYATGMAGKWHLGHHKQFLPIHHGFDEYYGLPYSNDMWPLHPEVGPDFPPLPMFEGDLVTKPGLGHEDQDQLTTQYTERTVKFIEKNKDRPFFFYLAHNMPHVPLHVSSKFKGMSQQGLYGDVIMEIDWSVGEVLKTLKKCGIDRNTLVIFTSDNGPWLSYGNHAGSAGPLREGKGTCWEGGTREPCIMRWPGKIPAGTVSDDMLMTIDLFPTIAKLVGADLPKHKIDGLDVWRLISGKRGAKNPHDGYYGYYEVNQLQSVTSGNGRWKLQLPHTYRTLGGRPGGRDGIPAKYEQRKLEKPELYDLKADISEVVDVADKHPDVVQHLLALAERARDDLGDSLTNRKGTGAREPGRKTPISVADHSYE
jgi:arylsulfatase A